MRRLILAAVVAAAVIAPVTAGGSTATVVDPWAGDWNTNTGTLELVVVSPKVGLAAVTAMGGEPCWQPTTYYKGSYDDPGSGRTGEVAGCTDGQTNFAARYVGDASTDAGAAGAIDVKLISHGHFSGTYTESGSSAAPYSGSLSEHPPGDGCCGSLVVNFKVSVSGAPDIPIAGPPALTSASLTGSGHATFTQFTKGSSTVFEATETKGQLVFDATTASGQARHYTFGIISGSLYSASTRRLGLLLRVTASNDPACPAGSSAGFLFLLPSYDHISDQAVLAGAPYAKTVTESLGIFSVQVTSTPCKNLGYGFGTASGTRVLTRLGESTPGA